MRRHRPPRDQTPQTDTSGDRRPTSRRRIAPFDDRRHRSSWRCCALSIVAKMTSRHRDRLDAEHRADQRRAAQSTGATITSVHNDAVGDFEAAITSGKPVYVLFHSLSCQPCVEISAVADKVMPDYEGKVVFVNAITDDASVTASSPSKFSFQYIPTSFFIDADGKIVDSFTGAMSEAEMKARLDKLVGAVNVESLATQLTAGVPGGRCRVRRRIPRRPGRGLRSVRAADAPGGLRLRDRAGRRDVRTVERRAACAARAGALGDVRAGHEPGVRVDRRGRRRCWAARCSRRRGRTTWWRPSAS